MKRNLGTYDKWSMTQEVFVTLLKRLHPDREQAGIIYENLRTRLMRYFELQGCPYGEECADDTMQRVARRLSEGADFTTENPYSFFQGVARNVLLEYWKSRRVDSLDDLQPAYFPAVDPKEQEERHSKVAAEELALECMQECLQALPPESRQIFIEYHQEQKRERIDGRLQIAKQLGIDITALRNRVTRLRDRLEKCIDDCIEKKDKRSR
jgi:RNA polymerase sigma factor (sigma-70 family)